MATLGEQLDSATVTELSRRFTTRTPGAEAETFRVSRLRDKVIVTRAAGGLVLDLDPASARRLARQLDTAAGEVR